MKLFSAYTAFTSPGYRTMNTLCAVMFFGGGFLGNIYTGSFSIYLLCSVMPFFLCFVDYFGFSGTSTRKQRSMNFIRSSQKGRFLFRNSVKTDLWIKEILLLLGFLGIALSEVIISTESEKLLDSLALILIMLPVSELSMEIIIFITRRIALTMAVQITICYPLSMISSLLMLLLYHFIPEEPGEFILYTILSFIVLEIVCIILAVFLYKDCIKGYDSSFSD